MEFSAKQIAEYIQGVIVGDENATVHTFAKIEEGIPGALSFLSNPKYTHYIYDTQSSIVLVNKDFEPEHEIKATLIKVDNAYESLAKLMTLYEMSQPKKQGIDPLASIASNAKIGKNVYIGPFACIEEGAIIGDNTYIHPHVTVGCNAKVGNNTILYPHVTIMTAVSETTVSFTQDQSLELTVSVLHHLQKVMRKYLKSVLPYWKMMWKSVPIPVLTGLQWEQQSSTKEPS